MSALIEERMLARLEKTETALLNEFHKNELRQNRKGFFPYLMSGTRFRESVPKPDKKSGTGSAS